MALNMTWSWKHEKRGPDCKGMLLRGECSAEVATLPAAAIVPSPMGDQTFDGMIVPSVPFV